MFVLQNGIFTLASTYISTVYIGQLYLYAGSLDTLSEGLGNHDNRMNDKVKIHVSNASIS